MQRRFISLCTLSLLACSNGTKNNHDASTAGDLAGTSVNITGAVATEFKVNISLGGSDGGAGGTASTLTVLGVWYADEILTPRADNTLEVDSSWQLCQLDIPNGIHVPYDDAALAKLTVTPMPGSISGTGEGAHFTQPPFAVVGGASLVNPVSDALPKAGDTICGPTASTGCITNNRTTGKPGVRVQASGLTPDADELYIDFRFAVSFDATAHTDQTLNGMVNTSSLESHILSCHLRGAGDCTPADVAALEAARPAIAISGGTMRSHQQGVYFKCPQMIADPQGSVTGVELQDAGVLAPDGGLGAMSFPLIQNDMDNRACGICHENIIGPGKLHLVFRPWTQELMRANYFAILPYTLSSTDNGHPGGKFVNQTPLPGPIRERWIQWISAGAPY